jgi:hypothetical protein
MGILASCIRSRICALRSVCVSASVSLYVSVSVSVFVSVSVYVCVCVCVFAECVCKYATMCIDVCKKLTYTHTHI